MLKILHQKKKTVVGTIISLLVALSMLSFGVNFGGDRSKTYAIRVNDHEISADEFYREKRELEQRYRQMFGKNFEQFSKQLNLNVNQMTVDNLTSRMIILDEASKNNFTVSDEKTSDFIKKQFFPKGFSKDLYAMILSQYQLSAAAFENRIKEDLNVQQLLGIFKDIAIPSLKEIHSLIQKDYTTFGVTYFEIAPESYSEEIAKVDENTLKKYFETHTADFEEPSKVHYDYAALDVNSFPDLIAVSDQDMEIYYSEHQSKFRYPDEVKAKHIQLRYPENASNEQKEAIRKKADLILTELKKGEKFAQFAEYYSDDFTTRDVGGELGWIPRGKFKAELERVLFKGKGPSEAALVELPYGFHIVKVDDFKSGAVKPYQEVKGEIKEIIKKNDGPAFLTEKVRQLYSNWQETKEPLGEFLSKFGIATQTTKKLFSASEDPEEKLSALTSRVLSAHTTKQQLIELKDYSILAEVKQYKESILPSYDAIRGQLLKKYVDETALSFAKDKVTSILEAVKKNPSDFENIGINNSLKPAKATGIRLAATPPDEEGKLLAFKNQPLKEAVCKAKQIGEYTESPLESNGKLYIYRVDSIAPPTEQEIKTQEKSYRTVTAQELSSIFEKSFLNTLKARAEIQVNPVVVQ
jgi:peptidyl-prolyl cis-trans isomerase D